MIGQVVNITGVQLDLIKFNESSSTQKQLPAENSIVEITVLDKSSGNSKILVDGNIFQAKLPVNVPNGDIIFGKVINSNPFTLSLNNFLTGKNLTGSNISLLLSKFQITDSVISQKVLKTFISCQKPISKGKLSKLIDIIEKENLQLDDAQLSMLISWLSLDDTTDRQPDKSTTRLFQNSIGHLDQKIFNLIEALNSSTVDQTIIEQINSYLVIDMDNGTSLNALDIKTKAGQKLKLINYLEEKSQQDTVNLPQQVTELKETLLTYTMLSAHYGSMGIFHDFIILKSNSDFQLFEFSVNSANKNKSRGNYKFSLNMAPDTLGLINAQGILSDSVLNLNFQASEKTEKILFDKKDELTMVLEKINIHPRYGIGHREQAANNSNTHFNSIRSVNVRV